MAARRPPIVCLDLGFPQLLPLSLRCTLTPFADRTGESSPKFLLQRRNGNSLVNTGKGRTKVWWDGATRERDVRHAIGSKRGERWLRLTVCSSIGRRSDTHRQSPRDVSGQRFPL